MGINKRTIIVSISIVTAIGLSIGVGAFVAYKNNYKAKHMNTVDSVGILKSKEHVKASVEVRNSVNSEGREVEEFAAIGEQYKVYLQVDGMSDTVVLDSKTIYNKFDVGQYVPVSLQTTDSDTVICKEFVDGY